MSLHEFTDVLQDEQNPNKNTFKTPKQRNSRKIVQSAQRKMYAMQHNFMKNFHTQMQGVRNSIQGLLKNITKVQSENQEVKRLPYSTLKLFETILRDIRAIKERVQAQNKKLGAKLSQREKIKRHKNATFKYYMLALNEKKHQLKQEILSVEEKVQKLQDSGYHLYVDFHVVTADQPTLGLSYNQRVLMKRVCVRAQICQRISEQLKRSHELSHRKTQAVPPLLSLSNIKSICQSQQANKYICLNTCCRVLQIFLMYKNRIVLVHRKIGRRKRMEASKKCIAVLTEAIKMYRLKIQQAVMKRNIGMQNNNDTDTNSSPKITKTDYFIYMNIQQKAVNKQMESKLFSEDSHIKNRYRSHSL